MLTIEERLAKIDFHANNLVALMKRDRTPKGIRDLLHYLQVEVDAIDYEIREAFEDSYEDPT